MILRKINVPGDLRIITRIPVFSISLHDMTTSKQSAPKDFMYTRYRFLVMPDVLAVSLI